VAKIDDDRAYLNGLSEHPDRAGDTSNMNPAFASALAASIRQARAAGLNVGVMSGYRDDKTTGSAYDAGGNSSHGYGLASDISGLDGPNGTVTKQWAAIAAANGLHNPYGVGNTKEFNHWQLPPLPLEQTPDLLNSLKTARATGDWNKVWAAAAPVTSGTMVASNAPVHVPGTTVNAANAPVPGALADQGPENVGSGGATAAQPGQPMDVRQIVFNKLTGAGLAPHQALGAVWSLAGESGKGLNPNAYNPNDPGGAVGIGQWNQERRTALENFAQTRGTAVTDPNTQADFLVDELTNKNAATYQPGVFAAMQKAGTAADATKTWTTQFERPKVDNSDARIKNGASVASLDSNGNFVLGAGAPTGSSPGMKEIPATASTPAAAPKTPESWFGKLFDKPDDGSANASSPFQQAISAFDQSSPGQAAERAQAPQEGSPASEQASQQRFAPGARNVSPGLASVPQTYGTTINAASQPLTWTDAPPGPPKLPAAGLRGSMYAQAPGISLNSVQPLPEGLGYGVDPNIGYGYG
jgi:hypothetical protein